MPRSKFSWLSPAVFGLSQFEDATAGMMGQTRPRAHCTIGLCASASRLDDEASHPAAKGPVAAREIARRAATMRDVDRAADLLTVLPADTANLPRSVVLDIWFSKDDRGLEPLTEAIRRLEQARVPTSASFNPEAEGHGDFDALMREPAQPL